jgi:hypothetical protein
VTPARARAYALAALAYACVATAMLLWPWRFSWPVHLENQVRWLPGGGIELYGPASIRSAGAASELTRQLLRDRGFSVEAWVASARADQTGPARIVGTSLDVDHRNFLLGQERDALVVRLRTARTNANGTPPLRVPGVFATPAPRHLLVSYDLDMLRVWVDGRLAADSRAPGGALSNWDPDYPLWIGNESSGTRPWLGRLFLVALYARPLGDAEAQRGFSAGPPAPGGGWDSRAADSLAALYVFDAGSGTRVADASGQHPATDLQIPVQFRVGERRLLAWRDRGGPLDRIANLLLFVPLGFAFDRAASRRLRPGPRAALGVALASAFPLGIELLQYGLPERISSLVDALLNAVSVCIGLALSRVQRARVAPPEAPLPPGSGFAT